jgi:Flp pilus assembly protein TadD
MSLLMKALEKAAKDRQASGAPGGGELSLEPIAPAAGASPAPAAPAMPAMPAARTTAGGGRGAPTRDQSQAATVMQAGKRSSASGALSFLVNRPVYAIGGLAALFLAGFGVYVYLQIAHPAMLNNLFTSAPPVRPVAVAPPAANQPPPGTVAQGQVTGSAPTAPAAAPAASPLAPPVLTTASNPPPAAPPAAAPTPGVNPATATAAAAAVAAGGATAAAPRPARAAEPPPEPAPAQSADRSGIRIQRGGTGPTLSPVLAEAYQSLEAGRLDAAQRGYQQVLRGEPRNIDALLGLAAVAAQQGDNETATKQYARILEIDPRNSYAQAGLLSVTGVADPLNAESRLKQLIAREPSAYLYFTLGNLYADQKQWAAAQSAYFQAHTLEPANPDYAYNLAVGLEHLNQPRPALGFYRQAVKLAQARGNANFSVPGAQSRIATLEKLGAE